MRFSYCLLISVCFLGLMTLIAQTSPTDAAQIVESKKTVCRYKLQGKIDFKDLDRLKEVAKPGQLFTEGNPEVEVVGDRDATLCLDSPGGNFVAGVAIAKFVSDRGIATVIDDGDECYSACALIFMAGRTRGAEEDYQNRSLHVGGSLGFHRPYLTLSNGDGKTYSAEDLNDSADFIVDAITFMLEVNNEQSTLNSDLRMKPSLVEGLLGKRRDELLMVDTIDQVGRWGITVFGEKAPKEFKEADIYFACSNFIAWVVDASNDDRSPMSTSVEELSLSDRPAISGISRSFKAHPGKDGYLSVSCTVNLYRFDDGTPYLRLCASDGFTGVTYGNCSSTSEPYDVWVNPISIHPPQTKLRDIR